MQENTRRNKNFEKKYKSMQVSGMDVRLVLAQALGGFVLAGAFSLGNLISRKKVGEKLIMETTALDQVDETMRVFLCEIQQQTGDKVAFLRLVGCIDRILFGEMQADLNQGKIINPDTRIHSQHEYTSIKMEHIPRLYAHFEECHNAQPNVVLDFKILLTQVLERVYKHLEKIWILTERSKQNE